MISLVLSQGFCAWVGACLSFDFFQKDLLNVGIKVVKWGWMGITLCFP